MTKFSVREEEIKHQICDMYLTVYIFLWPVCFFPPRGFVVRLHVA